MQRLDVVGVVERMDDWLALVCSRAGIWPCGDLGKRNVKHYRDSTRACQPASQHELRTTVQEHALADVKLHAEATARFVAAFDAHMKAKSPPHDRWFRA